MPMIQNPDGTITRLPYPGEPGYQGGASMGGAPMGGAPMAGSMPGLGYDSYLAMMRQAMLGNGAPRVSIAMPKPPPRFPTPGRMDGVRVYQTNKPRYDRMG